ncbi:MAG: hypothetical protein IPP93_08080 [Chitinophagaceae bacterium]|nr:hypothetical protein [Chitinophagaceae bacterium]
MKNNVLGLFMLLSFAHIATAQSVGVGTNTPNSSAILDVSSTSKGVLLPRMTTVQRDAIVNPAAGLTIYNTDDQCTDTYNGTTWFKNCGLKQEGSVIVPGDTWTKKTDFGGIERFNAIGFSIGAKGYIGTGVSYYGDLLKDFWEYSPGTNSWSQIADMGNTGRYFATGFSIGNKGYAGTRFGEGNYLNDLGI